MALLCVIILIVEIFAAYMVYNNIEGSLYDDFYDVVEYSVETGTATLRENVEKMTAKVNAGTYDEGDFVHTGSFNKETKKIVIDGTQYDLSDTVDFSRAVNFYSVRELSDGQLTDGSVCAVYVKGSELFFQSTEVFTGYLSLGGLYSFCLLSNSGRILMNEGAAKSKLNDYDYTNEQLYTENTETRQIEIDGVSYLLLVAPAELCEDDYYYVMALADYSLIEEKANKAFKNTIAILLTSGFITVAAYLVFLFFTIVRRRKIIRLRDRSDTKCYVVDIDASGKVLKSNDQFTDDFDVLTLFDKKVGESKFVGYVEGDCFAALLFGKDATKYIVDFVVVKIDKSGYKLIGIKTPSLNVDTEEIDYVGTIEDELQKKFDSLRSTHPRLLYGNFIIQNISNIEAMFGKGFRDNVFNLVAHKVKEDFETIYVLSNGHIVILCYNDKQIDAFTRDMKEYLDRYNAPVPVAGGLVNIDCRAGFVLVDSMLVGDFDYVERCALAVIKRTFAEKDQKFFIYHESQKKLYARYIDYNFNLKQMLDNNSFELEYQPQYNVKKNKVVGFEALFRVKKHLQLEIRVYDLIVYAEKTGNMMLLGEFIFSTGMRFAKSIEGSGVSISLNVSPIQLMQAGFVDSFLRLYDSFDLKPGAICVEVTESFLMENFNEVVSKLKILQSRGIYTHLDDFGTSYSSFLYLKNLPINSIKVDREFVKDIIKDEYSKTITRMVIDLCKKLELYSIIEGVETEEQKVLLEEYGCDIIQGYLIGRSMSEEKARELIGLGKKEEPADKAPQGEVGEKNE